MEASIIEQAMRAKGAELGPDADIITARARAMTHLIDNSKTLNTLHRYQRDYRRAYEKAEAELRAVWELEAKARMSMESTNLEAEADVLMENFHATHDRKNEANSIP